MDSQGFWADLRRFVLRGDVFGLAIAVLVGTALFQLLYAFADGIAVPFARGILDARSVEQIEMFGATQQPLYFTFRGYTVAWGEVLSLGVTFVAGLILVVFLRRQLFGAESESEPENEEDRAYFEDETEYKTCPECLSEIPVAAHRCAYCTAALNMGEK